MSRELGRNRRNRWAEGRRSRRPSSGRASPVAGRDCTLEGFCRPLSRSVSVQFRSSFGDALRNSTDFGQSFRVASPELCPRNFVARGGPWPAAARLLFPKCPSGVRPPVFPFRCCPPREGGHPCRPPSLKLLSCSLSLALRTLLRYIATVWNGREQSIWPSGEWIVKRESANQRANPLPRTVMSFAPPADACRLAVLSLV